MTYQRTAPKTGRNDACPCGSGKKYKKCCLGSDWDDSNSSGHSGGDVVEPVTSKLRRTRLFASLPEDGLAELISDPGVQHGDLAEQVEVRPAISWCCSKVVCI